MLEFVTQKRSSLVYAAPEHKAVTGCSIGPHPSGVTLPQASHCGKAGVGAGILASTCGGPYLYMRHQCIRLAAIGDEDCL